MKAHIAPTGANPSIYVEREPGAICCDVWLLQNGAVYPLADGGAEYDVEIRAINGVVWWPGLEEDVRRRFNAWWNAGKPGNGGA